jgi:L-alanine-DL-glutamate epimerase-like enolase superfamily enzyme
VRDIYGGAAGFLEDCRTLIIRVQTDDGVEGWGEATQGRPGNTYETLETMDVMARKYFAPARVHMDLELTGAVIAKLQRTRLRSPDHQSRNRDSHLRRWRKRPHWSCMHQKS